MTCDERDQDLLLMAVGEISLPGRLRIGAHLLSCRRCRERQALLAGASTLIARTIHTQAGAFSARPGRRPAERLGVRLRVSILILLLALFGLLILWGAGILRIQRDASRSTSHRFIAGYKQKGCAPGLPNDHCQ